MRQVCSTCYNEVWMFYWLICKLSWAVSEYDCFGDSRHFAATKLILICNNTYLCPFTDLFSVICRIVKTGREKATWTETDCDVSNIRCSEIFTVFLWSSNIYNPRTNFSSWSSLYQGTWDRLSRCLTYYSHADSLERTSRYLHFYSRCCLVHCSCWLFSLNWFLRWWKHCIT